MCDCMAVKNHERPYHNNHYEKTSAPPPLLDERIEQGEPFDLTATFCGYFRTERRPAPQNQGTTRSAATPANSVTKPNPGSNRTVNSAAIAMAAYSPVG